MKEDYLKELPSILKGFSTYIGDNSWCAGNEVVCNRSIAFAPHSLHPVCSFQLSYADFHLYEMLDQHKVMCAQVLDDFPNLKVSFKVHKTC